MAKAAKGPQPSPPANGYLTGSRRPLVVLGFVLPMLVAYEVGTFLLLREGRVGYEVECRVIAFNWVRSFFSSLGATGQLVAPLSVVGILLGWHIFSRQRWELRPNLWLGMWIESVMLSIPLFVLGGLVAVLAQRGGAMWLVAVDGSVAAEAVLGLGAGVYEELVFRLIAFALLHLVLHDVIGISDAKALAVAVVASSLAFSGYHYLGDEPFAWQSFIFRSTAGIWLGIVFLYRGYGISAGSHAAYDVILALLR